MTTISRTDGPVRSRPLSALLNRMPRLRLAGLLILPTGWLALIYVLALILLLVTSLWTVDTFTGAIHQSWTFDNIKAVLTESIYQKVALRTLFVALAVTVIDVILALPIAFFIAKVAPQRWQKLLVAAVLMPLWASYLVKVYAWRNILADGGLFSWLGKPFGLESPGYSLTAVIITLSYVWLPYMILPIHAGFERIPNSLLEASGDLGAAPGATIRWVILPLLKPAVIAGTIFTFSLSLGDYITVQIVGGTTQMLGNVVYANVGAANNLPLASAVSLVPIVIVFAYLLLVRRTGALKNV
ncbi:spermidine/putrescine ABC transporter permease [Gordonia spumicola]|uniref:Spermidine/putrescine ABC transporter permease n=1 Tax=Gordonia spumicola TaxID=589161 RepID=A0A7I9V8U1_9ACTN|nr:ABC transporter permease [Gordonia spumicola]GEE01510.1 spermidine/putrescine ABC transporter permease [Gordonia spumicola]